LGFFFKNKSGKYWKNKGEKKLSSKGGCALKKPLKKLEKTGKKKIILF